MKTALISKILFYSALISYGFSFYADKKAELLPQYTDIKDKVSEFPSQEEIEEEAYYFSYRGSEYLVEPVADYELSGLVVSHNDPSEFSDIYHTKDSVDFRDICVIWGDNVLNNAYHEVDFWSEPFSCWVKPKNWEAAREFENNHLSNNHILSRNQKLIDKINNVRIGDQIVIKGSLVNYSPKENPSHVRETSLSRDDTGNGACEIIMVDDFKLLEAANTDWRKYLYWSVLFSKVAFIVSVIFFFADTYGFYYIFNSKKR